MLGSIKIRDFKLKLYEVYVQFWNTYKNFELTVFYKFNLLELELFSIKKGGFLLVYIAKELY